VSALHTPAGQLLIFRDEESQLRDSFERFHQENPHVYQVMVKLARRWRRRHPGRRCGIGMLFETARWYLDLTTVGEPLNLNNNYRAFYARLIMSREPDLDGIFETRRQRIEYNAERET
jgi:hypothetical protein